jgi:hypothetical protein
LNGRSGSPLNAARCCATYFAALHLQLLHELAVGLDPAERRFEVLECQNVRHMATAVRCAEQDIQIRAIAFRQRLVRRGVSRAAAVKIDVRRNDGTRRLYRTRSNGQTGSVGFNKKSVELFSQFGRNRLVDPAHMRRSSRRLAAKFEHDGVSMLTKPRTIEIVVFVEHGDKTCQLFAHQ